MAIEGLKSLYEKLKTKGIAIERLWDCLTDLYGEPIHIEIVGFDVLAQEFEDAAD